MTDLNDRLVPRIPLTQEQLDTHRAENAGFISPAKAKELVKVYRSKTMSNLFRPNRTNYACTFTNAGDYPEDFINAIPRMIEDEILLIRSMKDIGVNVVITVAPDAIEELEDLFPEVHEFFMHLASKNIYYVFISPDF